MKSSIIFILILASTMILSIILPWWIIVIIALGFTYFGKMNPLLSFIIPFAAVFIAWVVSIYIVDNGSVQNILGKLLNADSNFTPYIAGLIGGLVAGIFGLAGSYLAPLEEALK